MSPVDKIKNSFKSIYDKLVGIKDSPQKIALGFGLGVFCGILPGTGPMASVVLAFVFRVNKVAALAGSLLTNTWLSLVTFVLAVKIGSMVTGADGEGCGHRDRVGFLEAHLYLELGENALGLDLPGFPLQHDPVHVEAAGCDLDRGLRLGHLLFDFIQVFLGGGCGSVRVKLRQSARSGLEDFGLL